MKCLVINLKKSIDRWNNILEISKIQDYELIRIDAIYGNDLDISNLNIDLFKKNFYPKNVIGCFLSHKKCWKYIIDNNIEEAIIFEDDIYIEKDINIVNEINKIKPFIPNDMDILLLSCIFCNNISVLNIISIIFAGININYGDINKYIYKPMNFGGTAAYYININGAKKLFKYINDYYHIDVSISKNSNINVYSLKNPLVTVKDCSINQTTISNNNNKILSILDNIDCKKMFELNSNVTLGWILNIPLYRYFNYIIKVYHLIIIILIIIIISFFSFKSKF